MSFYEGQMEVMDRYDVELDEETNSMQRPVAFIVTIINTGQNCCSHENE